MPIYHNHHIIPKYMDETNPPDNMIRLSLEDHIETHKLLYMVFHNEWDRIAYLAMSGQIGKEEIITMKLRRVNKGRIPWNKGKSMSEETKEKCRRYALGKKASKKTKMKMRLSQIGKTHSEDTKRKMSLAQKHDFTVD